MNYQNPVVVAVSKALVASVTGTVAILGFFTSQPAIGATVTYDFTVNIPTGAYAGQHSGSFSYDDSTELVPCISDGANRLCAIPSTNALKVQFNFLRTVYNETQDYQYTGSNSVFPALFFPPSYTSGPTNFISGGLSFLVAVPEQQFAFFILGPNFRVVGLLGDDPPYGTDADNIGGVLYSLQVPTGPKPEPKPEPSPPIDSGGGDSDHGGGNDGGSVAVPEPSEIAGSALGLGLLGLGWYWRRRKAAKIDLDR